VLLEELGADAGVNRIFYVVSGDTPVEEALANL
jgi:hypothetical protein